MTKLLKFSILCLLIVQTLSSTTTRKFKNSNLVINDNKLTLNTNETTVSFFALGDWGGSGLPLISKTPAELSSALQLGKMGSTLQTKFQIGLGDNFYFYGVKDVNDGKFKEIFEEVYSNEHLKNTPWFNTLGNHDYYGNAQAQIDYMAKSNRWILPSFNYTVDVMTDKSQKKLVTIVMIDTIKLCGNSPFTLNPFKKIDSNTPVFASTADQTLANLYFKDLESRLKTISESSVPYIIVGGHFPVYSAAEHGSTKCLVERLAPLLHKYKVSAYISGHDHNLQHISVTDSGSTVEYMVSGANSLNANSEVNLKSVPTGSLKFRWPTTTELIYGGFLMFQASDKNMTVNFVKADGKTLYQKIILPRTVLSG